MGFLLSSFCVTLAILRAVVKLKSKKINKNTRCHTLRPVFEQNKSFVHGLEEMHGRQVFIRSYVFARLDFFFFCRVVVAPQETGCYHFLSLTRSLPILTTAFSDLSLLKGKFLFKENFFKWCYCLGCEYEYRWWIIKLEHADSLNFTWYLPHIYALCCCNSETHIWFEVLLGLTAPGSSLRSLIGIFSLIRTHCCWNFWLLKESASENMAQVINNLMKLPDSGGL